MSLLCRLSVVEQSAALLREGLRTGRWKGQLPGVVRLAQELGVATKTLRAALLIVEAEGLVKLGANGRSRHVPARVARRTRPLRIGILLFDPLADEAGVSMELYLGLQRAMEVAGFSVFFLDKSQHELGHNVRRIASHVRKARADAWVVGAGPRALLEWFAAQPFPTLALFGNRAGLPIAGAGPNKLPALLAATRQLIALGHRRITLVCRGPQRHTAPGHALSAFLAELAAHGCRGKGDFNLPAWEETPAGLRALFTTLFHTTPPTALILDETPIVIAGQQFLAERKLPVPEQVSIIATDRDPCFQWCQPPVAHIAWRVEPVIRRIVQWATALSHQRTDQRQVTFLAEFIPGGTIGPVWKG
jgi:DNA-binding LacI/PurR family transcriptional regulator